MDRHQSAFAVVDAQPSGRGKVVQDVPKIRRRFHRRAMMMRVSSAYWSTIGGSPSTTGCLSRGSRRTIRCRTSAARRKRWGDIGSPWRRPHLTGNHAPGTPLSSMVEREERRIASIHAHHLSGKPRTSITQLTESNALAKFFIFFYTCLVKLTKH